MSAVPFEEVTRTKAEITTWLNSAAAATSWSAVSSDTSGPSRRLANSILRAASSASGRPRIARLAASLDSTR